jgi:hypothetical protein
MDPFKLSKEDFLKLNGKRVRIVYEHVPLFGILKDVKMDDLDEPNIFDLDVEEGSLEEAKKFKLKVPKKFPCYAVQDIEPA